MYVRKNMGVIEQRTAENALNLVGHSLERLQFLDHFPGPLLVVPEAGGGHFLFEFLEAGDLGR